MSCVFPFKIYTYVTNMLFQYHHIFTLLCVSRYLVNSAEISDETPLRAPYNANDSQWPIPDVPLEETNDSNNTFQITTSASEDAIEIGGEASEENNDSEPEVIDVMDQTMQPESESEPETSQVPDRNVPDTYSAPEPDNTNSEPEPVSTKRTVETVESESEVGVGVRDGINTYSEGEVKNSSTPIKGQFLTPIVICLCLFLNSSMTISLF